MTITGQPPPPLTRESLYGYFLGGAAERDEWKLGMEVEKLGRDAGSGRPIPYDGQGASVRSVLELLRDERGGDPVFEADNLIGLDAPWGGISLEPGGQVEWSSRPQSDLAALDDELRGHLAAMRSASDRLGVRWLDVAVDPELPVSEMIWMPKARYKIMRDHLGRQGRLAHRMMTQTASIQAAFDYEDPDDWKRKFVAAALLAPVATALFANSSRVDGGDSGHRSYREAIWRETDPDRCGLPAVVFDDAFDLERWLDWILSVPTLFLHRARGLVPSGGEPFACLLGRSGCDAVKTEDWETHVSTIFTEVRSYTYLEVRSADLQPDELCISVPVFWAGILYHDGALDEVPRLTAGLRDHRSWEEAMRVAAREGLDGVIARHSIRDLARSALALSAEGLKSGAAWVGDPDRALGALARLAARHGLEAP
jgi:glutamate--cysteine ligase